MTSMTSILQYPFINGVSFLSSCMCRTIRNSPVYNWLLFGKLGESQYAVPRFSPVLTTASGPNRYLQDVVTLPMPPSTISVNLAAAEVSTFTFPYATFVTSSAPAVATATIANGVVTVTGVAAGTSTVVVRDIQGNIISVITVTV